MSKLHVYSARCSWHGPIEKAGLLDMGPAPIQLKTATRTIELKPVPGGGLPCCPFCKSVLFQIDEDKFWKDCVKYAKQTNSPNYPEFMLWLMKQPRCWPTVSDAAAVFFHETGKLVPLSIATP